MMGRRHSSTAISIFLTGPVRQDDDGKNRFEYCSSQMKSLCWRGSIPHNSLALDNYYKGASKPNMKSCIPELVCFFTDSTEPYVQQIFQEGGIVPAVQGYLLPELMLEGVLHLLLLLLLVRQQVVQKVVEARRPARSPGQPGIMEYRRQFLYRMYMFR
jgi:hypothetical protein